MTAVALTRDGFDIDSGQGELSTLQWPDIREIFAFKVDLGCCDTIRLGFRIDNSSTYFEVDEDWHGFKELLVEIERRYRIDDQWWSQVAFPAFAANRTTLWSVSPS